MSWVSVEKFKTVCEAIKTYVIGQADDAYNKAVTKMGDYVKKSGDTMTGDLVMMNDETGSNSLGLIIPTGTNVSGFNISETRSENLIYTANYSGSVTLDEYIGKQHNLAELYTDRLYFERQDENSNVIKMIEVFASKDNATLADYNIKLEKFLGLSHKGNADENWSNFIACSDVYDFVFLSQFQDGSGSGAKGKEKLARLICGSPTLDYHAATKKYVDDAITSGTEKLSDTYVKKSGDTMTGELNMGSKKITSLAAPTANTDATNKTYVDTGLNAKVNTTDEMTDTELNTILALFA